MDIMKYMQPKNEIIKDVFVSGDDEAGWIQTDKEGKGPYESIVD